MYEGPCENCGVITSLRCSDCNKLGITQPSCIGFFHSRECQKEALKAHKAIHKAILKGSKDTEYRGINETIVISLKEAQLKGFKPNLFDNDLNLVFIGARDVMEYQLNYERLVTNLRAVLYPELKSVNITMCGPDVSDRPIKPIGNDECRYTVTTKKGTFEALYPDPDIVRESFSCGVILHPGFTDHLLSWKPAMDIIIQSNILVITTGYSNYDRLTRDAIHEIDLVSQYYGAKMILTPTFNKCTCLLIFRNGVGPSAYYSIFKGPDPEVVKLSYEETIYKMRDVFLRYVGHESINYEGNPIFGETCLMIADDLAAKKLEIPLHKKLSQIENLAHSYRSWRLKSKEYIKRMLDDEEDDEKYSKPDFSKSIMQQMMQQMMANK